MDKKLDKLGSLKHWDLVDCIDETHYYLASKNKSKLIACISAPHSGNKFKWLLRVANFEDFDRWSLAEIEKYYDTFADAVDMLTSIDVEQKLKEPTEDNDMGIKIVFGVATFLIGMLTIGLILFISGVFADSVTLMDFGLIASFIAYGIILGSIFLFIIDLIFDKFRSM